MNTQEVANRLVELCRTGQYGQAIAELYSDEIVSKEPIGTPDREVKGLQAIANKGKQFEAKIEKIHKVSISDPVVAENFFSVNMLMHVDMKGVPHAIDMDEICVYQVRDGKIILEQFFYTPQ